MKEKIDDLPDKLEEVKIKGRSLSRIIAKAHSKIENRSKNVNDINYSQELSRERNIITNISAKSKISNKLCNQNEREKNIRNRT